MRILGIDPGLYICGYGCIESLDNSESLVEAGFCQTDKKKSIEIRLNQIAGDISCLLDRFSPDIMAVEQLYSHYAHPRTSILMGHARGVILQLAASCGIEVISYSATKVKKSATGNGRASKQQVQNAVTSILSLSSVPEPNDVSDAIAIALCCVNDVKKKEMMV